MLNPFESVFTEKSPQRPDPEGPPYDSRQIANWFVDRAKEEDMSLTIMKLVKIVYMAHGWCLAALSRPLIDDDVEAWDYGPVIPEVYYTFRVKGAGTASVSRFPRDNWKLSLDSKTKKLLEEVWNRYKSRSALQLSDLTHAIGGPWDRTYQPGVRYQAIPNKLTGSHYRSMLNRTRNIGRT